MASDFRAGGAGSITKLGGSGGDDLSSFYVGRNTLWTLAKNMPTSLLLRHCVQIVGAQLFIGADALCNWRGSAARARLRGQLVGLFGLPRVLRQRATIQARRTRHDEEIDRLLV